HLQPFLSLLHPLLQCRRAPPGNFRTPSAATPLHHPVPSAQQPFSALPAWIINPLYFRYSQPFEWTSADQPMQQQKDFPDQASLGFYLQSLESCSSIPPLFVQPH